MGWGRKGERYDTEVVKKEMFSLRVCLDTQGILS